MTCHVHHLGFFFSTEILPETGSLATLREIAISVKNIRFDLNLISERRSNKLRAAVFIDEVAWCGGYVLCHCPSGLWFDSTTTC
jgi:hypothetical protein